MPPTKLSDTDKQEILALYRQTEETTSSLAERFAVSTSTISRILKQTLAETEYDSLIQQKRSGSNRAESKAALAASSDVSQLMLPDPIVPTAVAEPSDEVELALESEALAATEMESDDPDESGSVRRQRKRSSTAIAKPVKPAPIIKPSVAASVLAPVLASPAEAEDESLELDTNNIAPVSSRKRKGVAAEAPVLAELEAVERDILKKEKVFDDLEDEDDEDDDLEEEELEDDDDDDDDDLAADADELDNLASMHIPLGKPLHILPLSEAAIPRICYLVVDRTSDLVTRPLKDFAELGQIPEHEVQEKTLPVFDNHRVAKRFMRRMQRVVKIPDGRVFLKVGSYLQAKGITRLLIDGQVYSL